VPLRPSLIFFTAACASKMRPAIFTSRSAAACISCAVSAMVPTLPQSTPPSGNSSSTSSEGCEVAEGIDILLIRVFFLQGLELRDGVLLPLARGGGRNHRGGFLLAAATLGVSSGVCGF